jgi:hypothetical protein
MIQSRFDWFGDECQRSIIEATWEGLVYATNCYLERLRDVLNVSNPGVRVKRKRGKGSYTIYPTPSKPGEPPRARSGFLKKNTIAEYDQSILTTRVGVTVFAKYGLWLELGTKFMKARPWLMATLKKFLPQIRELAVGGGQQKAA